MSAIEAILSFDGKHVDQLKSAVSAGIDDEEWGDVASFFDHDEVRYQTASTWLVKAALEKAQAVPSSVLGSFCNQRRASPIGKRNCIFCSLFSLLMSLLASA